MTVLSRGARVRRGGRRPGWALLTALLVLAIGASSALVFTNRVELLKLAVVLALWAAVAGAFMSVIYRRQSDADQARARDVKLVYDLQLDREISARREYELTVESQLRGELAAELRAGAADEVAALRAELTALRTSLEILFDTELEHRPALETMEKEAGGRRALRDRARNGESPPADWVASDRIRHGHAGSHPDDESIIDVPEVPHDEREGAPLVPDMPPPAGQGPLLPPLQPAPPRDASWERARMHYDAPAPPPGPLFEPRYQQPPPLPQSSGWRPAPGEGQWLPSGTPGSYWAPEDPPNAPDAPPSGGWRRRAQHSSPEDQVGIPLDEMQVGRHFGEPDRRSRSRHSAEYRDYDPGGPAGDGRRESAHLHSTPPPAPAPPPAPSPPPRLAPPPTPEPAPRHRSAEPLAGSEVPEGPDGARRTEGQSVADLIARLQTDPTGGGRRRRHGS